MSINKRHFEYMAAKRSTVKYHFEDLIPIISNDLLNHFETLSDEIDDFDTLKISINFDISEVGDE